MGNGKDTESESLEVCPGVYGCKFNQVIFTSILVQWQILPLQPFYTFSIVPILHPSERVAVTDQDEDSPFLPQILPKMPKMISRG